MFGADTESAQKEREKKKLIRVKISGRVCSVGYRAWVVTEAKQRRISGWVRNRRDETVEAVFFGKESAVDSMVNICHVGPPASRVSRVRIFPYLDNPAADSFIILPTL